MERKMFPSEVKEFDEGKLIVTHAISCEKRDRGGEVLLVSGMQINGRPVVLLQHGYSEMGTEPVGKPLRIWAGENKGEKAILATTQFYPDATGKRLFEKVSKGYMPNFSIGWLALKEETRSGPEGLTRLVTSWELLEYSLVAVPMQPLATTLDKTDKALVDGMQFKILRDRHRPVQRLEDLLPPKILREAFEDHVSLKLVPSLPFGRWGIYNIDTDEIQLSAGMNLAAAAACYSQAFGLKISPEEAPVALFYHELHHWQRRRHLAQILDSGPDRREAEGDANSFAAQKFMDWRIDLWAEADFHKWLREKTTP